MDLLEKRLAEGLTVIMATHDLELAAAWANQILLLEDGSLKPLSAREVSEYISSLIPGEKKEEERSEPS